MVPLRAVADALGLTVDWNGNTKTAIFTNGMKTIYFSIGSTVAYTTDGTVEMDTAAVIVNDRTYAPIRYLAEYFGYTVGWDTETKTVQIAENSSYYLRISLSSLTAEVGETITVTLSHNCPGASVFLSTPNFNNDTGRYSQSYKWYDDYSVFQLTGREAGTCVIQYYYDSGNEIVYSEQVTITFIPAARSSIAPVDTFSSIVSYVTDASQNEQNALLMCQSAMTASSAYYGKYYAERAQEYYAKIVTDMSKAIELCGDYDNLDDLKVPLATIYGINVYGANYAITNSNYLEYVIETSTQASLLTERYEEVIALLNTIKSDYT